MSIHRDIYVVVTRNGATLHTEASLQLVLANAAREGGEVTFAEKIPTFDGPSGDLPASFGAVWNLMVPGEMLILHIDSLVVPHLVPAHYELEGRK